MFATRVGATRHGAAGEILEANRVAHLATPEALARTQGYPRLAAAGSKKTRASAIGAPIAGSRTGTEPQGLVSRSMRFRRRVNSRITKST